MGKKTKGVSAFKKYINSGKKKKIEPTEHDKSFEEIKDLGTKRTEIKKTIKF